MARAIGGLLSGVGVQSFTLNPGATSGSGLVVNHADFGVPTYIRLYDGTSWADLVTGLTLLAAVAVIALPRAVWSVPVHRRWPNLPAAYLIGVGSMGVLTTVGAAIATANWLWNGSRISGPAEAVNVSEGLAAVALSVLCVVLCRFAWPYLRASPNDAAPGYPATSSTR